MSEMRYYSKELGDKNFKTVNDVLKVQRDMIVELQEQVVQLKGMVSTLNQQLVEANQRLNMVFVKSMGTGATE